jgi:ribosomal protein S27AE
LAMTPETYVIGAIVFSVIVVGLLYGAEPINVTLTRKCSRCGTETPDAERYMVVGNILIHVVPDILVPACPKCGYAERSWA